jgi:general secretion pathway protein G
MVVAVVLAILAAAVMSSLVSRAETARRARAQADIATFETLLELYYLDVGRYPATEEGLRVLYYPPSSDEEKWKGPYVKKPLFADPWARDYVYRSPGQNSSQPYEILSYGKDGQEGGEGDAADVTSWVPEQGS